MFSQVVDEPASSTQSPYSLAERGVELDQTVEEESGDRIMLKTAGRKECMSDGGGVTFRKTFPYTIFVTQRGENIERARQNARQAQRAALSCSRRAALAPESGTDSWRRARGSSRIRLRVHRTGKVGQPLTNGA